MKRTARLNLRLTTEDRDLFEFAYLCICRDRLKGGGASPSRNGFAAELLRVALLGPNAGYVKTRLTRSRASHDRKPG